MKILWKIYFNDIEPPFDFFHEGKEGLFSIITNKGRIDSDFIYLRELKNCQNLSTDKSEFPDYKNYNNIDFLTELKKILNIKNPVTKSENAKSIKNYEIDEGYEGEENENEEKEIKSIEEITKNYIFTPDNFIKMILILLRIRANIPVIMMWETGCGKALLIRKLSELLNDGSNKKMKILNIHEDITYKDIINFLEKNVIKDVERIEKRNQIKKIEYEKDKKIFIPEKLWFF